MLECYIQQMYQDMFERPFVYQEGSVYIRPFNLSSVFRITLLAGFWADMENVEKVTFTILRASKRQMKNKRFYRKISHTVRYSIHSTPCFLSNFSFWPACLPGWFWGFGVMRNTDRRLNSLMGGIFPRSNTDTAYMGYYLGFHMHKFIVAHQ